MVSNLTLKRFLFSTIWLFPPFHHFFPKLRRYSQRSYNLKNHLIQTNFQSPRGFELHEFNCISIFPISQVYDKKQVFNSYRKGSVFWRNRSSRPEVFCKKGALGNFTKFTGKHLCQSLFFNKKDSGTGVFLWILWNFWEHLFLQNAFGGCFLRKSSFEKIFIFIFDDIGCT